jgi:hypothetical protein
MRYLFIAPKRATQFFILYMVETSTRSRGEVRENSKEVRLCCVCIDFYHRGANIAKI